MPTWYTKFIDKLLNVFSNEGNGAFLMNKIKPDAYNIQLFVGDSIDMNLNFKVASDMFALQLNGHQTSSAPQQEPILICPGYFNEYYDIKFGTDIPVMRTNDRRTLGFVEEFFQFTVHDLSTRRTYLALLLNDIYSNNTVPNLKTRNTNSNSFFDDQRLENLKQAILRFSENIVGQTQYVASIIRFLASYCEEKEHFRMAPFGGMTCSNHVLLQFAVSDRELLSKLDPTLLSKKKSSS